MTKETLASGLPPGQDNLAFDSNGNLYVSHYQDGSLIEIQDGSVRTVIEGGPCIFGGLHAVQSGGKELLCLSDTWCFRSYDLDTKEEIHTERNIFLPTNKIQINNTVAPYGNNLILCGGWCRRYNTNLGSNE